MANTVYGPYSPTTWVDNVTAGNHTTLNNLESQSNIALHGLNSALWLPFILSGLVATKDGTTANQLDVTSGTAFPLMTDGTLGCIVTAASTAGEFTTATPSSTYYLYLQPDGTWYWSTSNTPATHSLEICTVATDGSGNISSVTDKRTLLASLLSGSVGGVRESIPWSFQGVAPLGAPSGALASGGSVDVGQHYYVVTAVNAVGGETAVDQHAGVLSMTTTSGNQTVTLSSIPTGPTGTISRHIYRTKLGNNSALYLLATIADNTTTTYSDTTADASLGAQNYAYGVGTFAGSLALLDSGGTTRLTVGSNGAMYFNYAPNSTGALGGQAALTIASDGTTDAMHVTDTSGNLKLWFNSGGAFFCQTFHSDSFAIQTDGSGNFTSLGNITFSASPTLTSKQSGGSATGLTFKTWSGSASVTPFSIGGQFNSALAYVDTSGHVHDAAGEVAVTGGASSGQPALSYGSGAPASLATNEIYFQVS